MSEAKHVMVVALDASRDIALQRDELIKERDALKQQLADNETKLIRERLLWCQHAGISAWYRESPDEWRQDMDSSLRDLEACGVPKHLIEAMTPRKTIAR